MDNTTNEQPAVGAVDNDLESGTWYRAACSGLWYRNPLAAGSFDAIKSNGRLLVVAGAAAVVLDNAPEKRENAFDCSAWLALLARWLAVERELRDEHTNALARGDAKDAEQWRAQWCGLKPRVDELAEEIGRARRANEKLCHKPA